MPLAAISVNEGVDTRTLAAYLGRRQIANTARYTKMDAKRFDGFLAGLKSRIWTQVGPKRGAGHREQHCGGHRRRYALVCCPGEEHAEAPARRAERLHGHPQ